MRCWCWEEKLRRRLKLHLLAADATAANREASSFLPIQFKGHFSHFESENLSAPFILSFSLCRSESESFFPSDCYLASSGL